MKKIKITLVNGDIEHIALTADKHEIGKPLNHPEYIGLAVLVGHKGFCIDPKAPQPVIVPPSQIKSIQLIDEK